MHGQAIVFALGIVPSGAAALDIAARGAGRRCGGGRLRAGARADAADGLEQIAGGHESALKTTTYSGLASTSERNPL